MPKSYNRRDFVRQGVKGLTGFLSDLRGGDTSRRPVEAGDFRIMSAMADYPGGAERIPAFIARPAQAGTYPAVIVIHETFGLVDHIKDVALRFAREGFVAVAPDLFTREAPIQSPDDPEGMRALAHAIPDARILADLEATIGHLDVLTFVDSRRIGAIGFCMGGLYAFLLAARTPRLRAAADFYGRIAYAERTDHTPEAPIDVVSRLRCPILGIFGDADPVVPVADVRALRDAMIAHKKPFEIKIYPDAPHAFFNDTRPSYRPEMAADAWTRTVTFFWKHLKGQTP
jgi:carboxymethylenebutenolidase